MALRSLAPAQLTRVDVGPFFAINNKRSLAIDFDNVVVERP